jgi:uncharacterized protein (TIGR03067 family)
MRQVFIICVGVLLASPCVGLGDDAKKDESKVDGTWLASNAELDGKKMPKKAIANLKLTLKEGKYEVVAESPDRGTVTYDNSAMPKQMDIKGTEGPNKGKTFLAIYELENDKLTICYDLSGSSRPSEFKTSPETRLFLVTYERQKSDKNETK